MKSVGKIFMYDGYYGVIIDETEKVDFSRQDFRGKEAIEVGDIVEFRKEIRDEGVRFARNIKILKKANQLINR